MTFRLLMPMILSLVAMTAQAAPDLDAVVTETVLPGIHAFDDAAGRLGEVSGDHCAAEDPELRAAYTDAFEAWIAISHLRFGPTEREDRAFALAFWPDSRGATPKTLARLIQDEDPVVDDPDSFTDVSIAGRGFYALEFLLYDDEISTMGSADYRCRLVRAIARDTARIAHDIRVDWDEEQAGLLISADNDTYRTPQEAAQELFKALATGLEFTADTRLGRPLGTFDQPRPNRAEARRSGLSLAHVIASLDGTRPLALALAESDPELRGRLDRAYGRAIDVANRLDDRDFSGVATPQGRLRVEALQQSVKDIRDLVSTRLGPELGVAAGFNALDGD